MRENIYGAAYVRSLEKDMFTGSELRELLSASEEDICTRLRDKGYDGRNAFEMLENEEEKTAEICAGLCADVNVRAVILAGADFHNIKAALKYEITGTGGKSLLKKPSDVEWESIVSGVKNGFASGGQDVFCEFAKEAYEEYKKTKRIEIIDRCLDRIRLWYIREKSEGSEFISGWAEKYAELCAEKERIFSGNERNGDAPFSQMLREREDSVMEYLKRAHFFFFSDDAVFAYFVGKNAEIKNLRLILYGKKTLAGERLRKAYV